MVESTNQKPIFQECLRIEEDAIHSAKGHFNAEAKWNVVHYILGVLTTVTAAWAGLDAITSTSALSIYLALIAALLAGTNTVLNPEKRTSKHGNAARQYKTLQNETRILRTISLKNMDKENIHAEFTVLTKQRDSLNESSPGIPYWAYKKAVDDIKAGGATYLIDGNNSDC